MRVNFALHRWQNLVCGRVGMLPLCDRILLTAPFFLRITPESAAEVDAEGTEVVGMSGGGCRASADIVVGYRKAAKHRAIIWRLPALSANAQQAHIGFRCVGL